MSCNNTDVLIFCIGKMGQTRLLIFQKVKLGGNLEHDDKDIATEEGLQLHELSYGNMSIEQSFRPAIKKVQPSP